MKKIARDWGPESGWRRDLSFSIGVSLSKRDSHAVTCVMRTLKTDAGTDDIQEVVTPDTNQAPWRVGYSASTILLKPHNDPLKWVPQFLI